MRSTLAFGAFLTLVFAAGSAAADPTCRLVEIRMKPVANLQIAAWIEDPKGNYVDTAYITRLTGSLGLANRPGLHAFKSDFRFPYGRRDMVLPVWAHKRNKRYGYVVMGGQSGNSPDSCQAGGTDPGECDDLTIGYHFSVSSPEPFYCSPSGGVTQHVNGMDVISCASSFYGSKGAYADSPMFSLYPPRADLTSFVDGHDGPDARGYSRINDLTAISGATPAGMAVIDPPIRWSPPADGKYILWVEASLEKDFNQFNNHPSQDDEHPELNGYGQSFLGQPSVIYSVPFTVGDTLDIETSGKYDGYGDWDGSTGTLHPSDMTITDMPGTGAGRFLDATDGDGTWRVKVTANPVCDIVMPTDGGSPGDGGPVMPTCVAPGAPTSLSLTPHASSLDVSFASASTGTPTARFDVRYSYDAIDDNNFTKAIASAAPPPGDPGSTVSTMLTGLKPQQSYVVGVRALAACGAASNVVTMPATTIQAKFVTLHGCFIATAAYGTPMAGEIDVLRRFRDGTLMKSPLGRLAVAAYYSLSPPIAAAISTDERLRAAARGLLGPVVRVTRAAERARAQ
jgi:hypothetical protein